MIAFSASDINLASQPFRRERAQNAAMVVGAVALLLSLILFSSLILRSRSQAADLRKVIQNQHSQLANLQKSQNEYSKVLSKPGNADVFAQSILLNELIARRTVSWTRVFRGSGNGFTEQYAAALDSFAAGSGRERNRNATGYSSTCGWERSSRPR